MTETQLVGAYEVVERPVRRLNVEHLETENTGGLSHGFDDQHTRHDRMLGEVTIEERLVDADILVSTNALRLDIQLHHPVHQQERITVGQVFANFVDVHHFKGKPVVKIGSAHVRAALLLQIKEAV
ncbi:hypothetical protein D9M71_508280 [compost metagenome]